MKRLICILRYCGFVGLVFTTTSVMATDFKVDYYGFSKGDLYIAMDPVSSWGAQSMDAANRAVPDSQGVMGIGLTGKHTRLGFIASLPDSVYQSSAVIEMDFYTIGNFPRLRLGYAQVETPWFRLRAGQDWDLFSPLNPGTNNTNACLGLNGNYGSRRPQMEFLYKINMATTPSTLGISIGEAEPGNTNGPDNISFVPLCESRIGTVFAKKYDLGISGFFTELGRDKKIKSWGAAFDATLKLHRLLELQGEYAFGSNMSNAGQASIAPVGNENSTFKTSGFWFEAKTNPITTLGFGTGIGKETVIPDLPANELKSNMAFYGFGSLTLGHFVTSVEYEYLLSVLENGKSCSASLIDISCAVNF